MAAVGMRPRLALNAISYRLRAVEDVVVVVEYARGTAPATLTISGFRVKPGMTVVGTRGLSHGNDGVALTGRCSRANDDCGTCVTPRRSPGPGLHLPATDR